MKKLLIVESPAKIKTIAKFLEKNFKIMSTVGHVKDLPENELGVHINDAITIDYVVLEKKDKLIADICKEARSADDIFLAPDPDREGEIIAWHVAQEIAKVVKDPQKIHRISFNEITKTAVEAALSHPGTIDPNKVAAQQARRVLDRWVGYEVSPILWRKISKGLSAGRVQSVALKLICDREEAIRTFKPQEYWSIHGQFALDETASFQAELTHIKKKKAEIPDQQQAEKLVADIKKHADYKIESIKDTKRAKNPAPPFMTSTLQQAAYNRLGFSVQKTMQIAQRLYEGLPLADSQSPIALITYMRTDSLRVAESALKSARSLINTAYGADYVPSQTQLYSKQKAQDAHEAIRPIDVTITPNDVIPFVDSDTARLYTLIWQRFIACQMKPAQYAQRSVTIQDGPYTFKVTGSTLLFDGFMRVYTTEEDDEQEGKTVLPERLQAEMPLSLTSVTPKQHFTQAPPRYTEASLVKELEKERIGRPSTYATIMKTIQARSYTELDTKKRFVPTELGMAVTKMLTEHLPKIMNVQFTATMEEDLDKIAQGEMKRDTLLRDFYTTFQQDLAAFRGDKSKRQAEHTNLICPLCGKGKLVIRFGKAGPFLGCERFPECTFTSNFQRAEDGTITITAPPEPKLLTEPCPQCGKPLRELQGKFGKFIACSGYPECTYIHQTKAKFPCPLCGGNIIKRSWKGNIFWGCDNYPKCKFSIAGDIEETPCPQCGTPYLMKRTSKQGITLLYCGKKDCGYKKEITE
jgi:DNA topoisomerase I